MKIYNKYTTIFCNFLVNMVHNKYIQVDHNSIIKNLLIVNFWFLQSIA